MEHRISISENDHALHRYPAMKTPPDMTFIQTCVKDTLKGLNAGISHFSGPSSTAVIYSLKPKDRLNIFDPHNLLGDHASILRSIYLENDDWSQRAGIYSDTSNFSLIEYVNDLQLDGVISYGGKSATVAYQMWFTEHHPDLFTTGPTERWLEHAVLRFSHDMANEKDLYTGISGSFLREYARHAIHDHIK